jgi:hypothetical protein
MSGPDPNLTEKCLRCGEEALAILPESTAAMTFYECTKCRWRYAKKPGEALHDRWMNPISLVLYPVIFQKDPREHIGRIAELFIEQKDRDEIITTVNEIDRELKEPTQRVSEILDFVHSPSEKIVREFLRGVSVRLKLHLRKSQGFDGACSVCGKPGSVQQIPGAPVSGCFCEDHVPSGSIRPIHLFIALALFLALGWLLYTLF